MADSSGGSNMCLTEENDGFERVGMTVRVMDPWSDVEGWDVWEDVEGWDVWEDVHEFELRLEDVRGRRGVRDL